MTQLQIDFTSRATGRALKQAGQQQARDSAGAEWIDGTLRLLAAWCEVRRLSGAAEFRFEEFRAFCEREGTRAPRSSNVWGTLPLIAARRGLIEWTGRYEAAESPRTHAHPVKVWRAR